jgi:hypothetical protein
METEMTDRFAGPSYESDRHKGSRLGTLWFSPHDEGDVTLSPLFDELDYIASLDVLGDIIGCLQREYDAIHKLGMKEFNDIRFGGKK